MTKIEFVNPAGMHRNPAFSQAAVVTDPGRTVYIGGQNAVDPDGKIIGCGDVAEQAAQVGRNVRIVLEAVGATPDDVVRWDVQIVSGQALLPAMQEFLGAIGRPKEAPTLSVSVVTGLAHPDFLLEVAAVAVV